MIASSCGVVGGDADLFKPGPAPQNFSDSSVGSFNEVFHNALLNDQGFNNFARFLVASSLEDWYKNNASEDVVKQYNNWISEADSKLESETTSLRNQFRRNFEIRKQTDLLDANGGSAESYKQTQILTNLFNDFSSKVFNKDYLGYFDENNKKINNPLIEDLNKPENWKNLKFYSKGYTTDKSTDNDDQMFADFQSFVFDKWVRQENPNLVSRLVFTNEDVRGGLDQIFNKKVVKDDLKASYNFQAFTDPKNVLDPLSPKLSTGFKQLVANNGLANYYNDSNKTVDFLNQFSSDSGGKLLMTSSDMFNTYDVAFSSAYVQQYQDLVNDADKDNGVASVELKPDNIMENFIFADNGQNNNAAYSTKLDLSSKSEGLKKDAVKIASAIRLFETDTEGEEGSAQSKSNNKLNEYYKPYSEYAQGNASLHEYIRPKTLTKDSKDLANQFILSRGKDGIHVMAIDGANYYLVNNTRNIEKQKEFLLFRDALVKNPDFGRFYSDKSYEFKLTDTVKKFFSDNNVNLILEFLLNAVDNEDSFLHKGGSYYASLLESLRQIKEVVKDLFNKKANYDLAKRIRNDALNVRDKIYERAKTYDDLIKDNKAEKIGIAGKLPHIASKDGSYIGLEGYYKQLLIANGLLDTKFATTKDNNGLTDVFNKVVKDAHDKFETSVKEATELLLLEGVSSYQYSQNVFVKSKFNDRYSLAINSAIQAAINLPTSTNNYKRQFYLDNAEFKEFYDASKNKFNDYAGLKVNQFENVIKFYYIQSLWTSEAKKLKYGSWSNQEEYQQTLTNYFNSLVTTTDVNDNSSLNYLRYLNAFRYLIKDNLAEFKTILSNQITSGVSANVSWTLTTGTKLDSNGNIADKQDPVDFTKFTSNPDYLQGSEFNFLNLANASSSSENAKSKNLNYSTVSDDNKIVYGFNGLSFTNSTSNLNDEVKAALYDNQDQEGIFYAFGSNKDEIMKHIEGLTSDRELDAFVELLRRNNVNVTLFDHDESGKSLDFEARKKKLTELLNNEQIVKQTAFTKFEGYVGQNKVASNDMTKQPGDFKPYQSKQSLTNWITYTKQINFNDVAKLGGESWLTNKENRLGLSINELLSIIATYAFESSSQNLAELKLINDQSLIKVNDKRLYDALTSKWVEKANN
ncbi:DUF3713 domain-containing protein [Mycoplasma sp. E35C]|uniref:DUF3713 domain-containing protein n=1 Tax=Mycoplasma sp. E35C TaxID=2801918 RepID=UPI002105319A|nr:DUF3713 domain-containing protein [Mycoplasma sp. E35C]